MTVIHALAVLFIVVVIIGWLNVALTKICFEHWQCASSRRDIHRLSKSVQVQFSETAGRIRWKRGGCWSVHSRVTPPR